MTENTKVLLKESRGALVNLWVDLKEDHTLLKSKT